MDPASPTRSLLIQQVTVSDTSGICNFRGSKKGELSFVLLPVGWALGQSWSVCTSPWPWVSCTNSAPSPFLAIAVRLTPKNITVVAGTDLVLPCRLSSNLAHARWTFGGRDLPAEQPGSFLYDARLQALVVMAAQPRHAGAYHCFSEEQGARLAAEGYLVAVVAGPSLTLEARAPLENLGLVWLAVVALGGRMSGAAAACFVTASSAEGGAGERSQGSGEDPGVPSGTSQGTHQSPLPPRPRDRRETLGPCWLLLLRWLPQDCAWTCSVPAWDWATFPTSWHPWPTPAIPNSASPGGWAELKCQWLCALTARWGGPWRGAWAPPA